MKQIANRHWVLGVLTTFTDRMLYGLI